MKKAGDLTVRSDPGPGKGKANFKKRTELSQSKGGGLIGYPARKGVMDGKKTGRAKEKLLLQGQPLTNFTKLT